MPRRNRAQCASEENILVLQGGGALGSYQAGVYTELAAEGIDIAWVAGISIGAINAAIIAGNAPEERVPMLESFWSQVSRWGPSSPFVEGTLARTMMNEAGAAWVATFGVPGFFGPRLIPPILQPPGSEDALSVYDTAPLRRTLLAHVDFDRINAGPTRLSVGAVNIRNGNFAYFDTVDREIGPEHIMASGALPPGFPPIEIDGEFYWDGGLVSNTPLEYVLARDGCPGDAAIFQVDLFSAHGPMPRTFADVFEREKDIRFSSRTRLNTDVARHHYRRSAALQGLLAKLPAELREDPDARFLAETDNWTGSLALVHLIYRAKEYETQSKDYLFSRRSVHDHWAAGRRDARRTLSHPDWLARPHGEPGLTAYDLTRQDVPA